MDKFLVPKSALAKTNPQPKAKKALKQATITSLKKVVPLDEVRRLMAVLEDSDASPDRKCDAIARLESFSLSKDLIRQTGVGRAVGVLRRSENEALAESATRLVSNWKEKVEKETQPKALQDVRCGEKEEAARDKARRLLTEIFLKDEGEGLLQGRDAAEAVRAMEFGLWAAVEFDLVQYRPALRGLLLKARASRDVRQQLLNSVSDNSGVTARAFRKYLRYGHF